MSKKAKRWGLILAGGASRRLFPELKAKPLLEVEGKTLLEWALSRLEGSTENFIIVNAKIAKEMKAALPRKRLQFAVEPEGRDTAAAVGFGLRHLRDRVGAKDDDWVSIISADQWAPDVKGFHRFLKIVEGEIEHYPESLFVGGSPAATKPEETHGQFGWVLSDQKKSADSKSKSRQVARFVEKPNPQILRKLKASGALINGGMFFGKLGTFLKAFKDFYPQVLKASFPYARLERQPIDRAIFEKHQSVRVVPLNGRWEDLGTWKDWAAQSGSEELFISSDPDFEIHAFQVKDLAIVQRGKKLLVIPLNEAGNLKKYLG